MDANDSNEVSYDAMRWVLCAVVDRMHGWMATKNATITSLLGQPVNG